MSPQPSNQWRAGTPVEGSERSDPSTLNPQPSTLLECESVRLFLDRARLVDPSLTLTERNAPAIAQICCQLDGIPLAIELAAARVKSLSVERIAERLSDRFRLLTGGSRTALPRQQTLRALIDWSYDLLSEQEKALLRRLAVFAGGWTLEAAEAVCSAPGGRRPEADGSPDRPPLPPASCLLPTDVLDLLTALIDKSLVWYEETAGGRYRLLETVRQYARERLVATEAGEEAAVRQRHQAFFLRLAEEVEPQLSGRAQIEGFDRLDLEHDNLRAALAFAGEGVGCRVWKVGSEAGPAPEALQAAPCGEAGLRLAGALWFFWFVRGHHTEGRERLREALARPEAAAWTPARAKALNAVGFLHWTQGNYDAARPVLEEALAIAEETGDRWNLAWSLHVLGRVATSQGEYERAQARLEESLEIWRELGDRHYLAWSLTTLGDVSLYQGDHGRALRFNEESVALLRALEDKNRLAYALRRLGHVALRQGERSRAAVLCRESLALNREVGERRGVAASLAALAGVAAVAGQPLRAAQLFGAADAVLESIGARLMPVDRMEHFRNLGSAHAQVAPEDEEAFRAAWAEGRRLPLEAAFALGMEEGGEASGEQEA